MQDQTKNQTQTYPTSMLAKMTQVQNKLNPNTSLSDAAHTVPNLNFCEPQCRFNYCKQSLVQMQNMLTLKPVHTSGYLGSIWLRMTTAYQRAAYKVLRGWKLSETTYCLCPPQCIQMCWVFFVLVFLNSQTMQVYSLSKLLMSLAETVCAALNYRQEVFEIRLRETFSIGSSAEVHWGTLDCPEKQAGM